MWCLINKRWVLFKHSELKWERASKKMSFLKELCSKSANCSRNFPMTGLSVTNSLVYGAVARRCAHELSHLLRVYGHRPWRRSPLQVSATCVYGHGNVCVHGCIGVYGYGYVCGYGYVRVHGCICVYGDEYQQFIYSVLTKDTWNEKGQTRDTRVTCDTLILLNSTNYFPVVAGWNPQLLANCIGKNTFQKVRLT